MLKMIISCGLGMSSSALTAHMQKEIKEKGWENLVEVNFLPFPLLMTKQDELDADIAFLCPHLMYYAKNEANNEFIKIPMYIIPARMYGTMNLQDLMEDAQDLITLYQDKSDKLWHFPEEKLLDIKRNVSHHKWIKKHPVSVKKEDSLC